MKSDYILDMLMSFSSDTSVIDSIEYVYVVYTIYASVYSQL